MMNTQVQDTAEARLMKLKSLLDQSLISQEEFEKKKIEIINTL